MKPVGADTLAARVLGMPERDEHSGLLALIVGFTD